MSEQHKHPRADQRKHHLVYKTICTSTGNYYIGMHSTDDLNDGYLGSGWRLHRSVKKYGKENFVREIIQDCKDRKTASLLEKELITPEMLADRACLNLRTGGTGQMCGYSPPTETRQKLSIAGTRRWIKDRAKLKGQVQQDLESFKLTRKQILEVLLTKEGHLNKNASRYLPPKPDKQLGDVKLGKRAVLNQAKWKAIWQTIQNSEFGDDPVELINAYVNKLKKRPKCKTCSGAVSFIRFNQPYATYCGNRCQLLDPTFKNPVLSRYQRDS